MDNRTWTAVILSILFNVMGIPFAVATLECYRLANGKDYSGTVDTTNTGKTCQRWDQQSPHAHSRTNTLYFPESVLSHAKNYCRNPDSGTGPWCYTIEATRWEYCDVPKCIDLAPEECKLDSYGLKYIGRRQRTRSWRACQRWDTKSNSFTNSDFSDGSKSAAENYCRNPDNKAEGPWCFTMDAQPEWEYCDVPPCPTDCKRVKKGRNYKGNISVTISGQTCRQWNSIPSSLTDADFVDGSVSAANNFCRNPGGNKREVWCYTSGTEFAYCAVPYCGLYLTDDLYPTTMAPTSTETSTIPPTTPETTTMAPTSTETSTIPTTTPETTTMAPTSTETSTIPPTTPETTTMAPTSTETPTIPPTIPDTTTMAPTSIEASTIPPTTPDTTTISPTSIETSTIPPTTPEASTISPTSTETSTIPPTTPETTTLSQSNTEASTIPPTTPETTIISPTSTETLTLPPTTPEATTISPTSTETSTIPTTTPETTTMAPTSTETSTIPTSTPETTTMAPTSTETSTIPPTTPETTTLSQSNTEASTIPPTTPETTIISPTSTETSTIPSTTPEATTVSPTSTETSTIPPTTPEAITISPTSTETSTIPSTTSEATTNSPTSTETTTILPTTLEAATISPTSTSAPTIPSTTSKATTISSPSTETTTIPAETTDTTTISPASTEVPTLPSTTTKATAISPTSPIAMNLPLATKEVTTMHHANTEAPNISVNNNFSLSWHVWSLWSSCTASCQGGVQSRFMLCKDVSVPMCNLKITSNRNNTYGYKFSFQKCNTHPCPVDGIWHQWSLWQPCSSTCSSGTRQRQRLCIGPYYNGNKCQGEKQQSEFCSSEPCPNVRSKTTMNPTPLYTEADRSVPSQTIGSMGIIIIALTFALIVFLDLLTLWRDIRICRKNLRGVLIG